MMQSSLSFHDLIQIFHPSTHHRQYKKGRFNAFFGFAFPADNSAESAPRGACCFSSLLTLWTEISKYKIGRVLAHSSGLK